MIRVQRGYSFFYHFAIPFIWKEHFRPGRIFLESRNKKNHRGDFEKNGKTRSPDDQTGNQYQNQKLSPTIYGVCEFLGWCDPSRTMRGKKLSPGKSPRAKILEPNSRKTENGGALPPFCPGALSADAHPSSELGTGGKPSTWLPPGGLVEQERYFFF